MQNHELSGKVNAIALPDDLARERRVCAKENKRRGSIRPAQFMALLAICLVSGCSLGETNEQEAARFEAAEQAAGYPKRQGDRPGAQPF